MKGKLISTVNKIDSPQKLANKIREIESDVEDAKIKTLEKINSLKDEIKSFKGEQLCVFNESTAYRNSDGQFFTISPRFASVDMKEPTHVYAYSENVNCSKEYDANQPYVSIIVPIYNAEKYLAKTLDSIVAQNLRNIEIICVNDGSTDRSQEILEGCAKNDRRIKILTKENGGQAGARNLGLDNAKGDFIGFMDSDDLIPKDFYEKLYQNAIAFNADVVQCRYLMVYEDGRENEPWALNSELMALESRNVWFKNTLLLAYSSGVVWNKIYKRELINDIRFFDDSSPWEDNPFVIMALKNAKKIVSCHDVFHYYLQRSDSSIHAPNPNVHFRLLKSSEYIVDYLNDKKNGVSKKDYKEFVPLLVNRMNWEYSQMRKNPNATRKDRRKYEKIHSRLLFKIKHLPFGERFGCAATCQAIKTAGKNLLSPFQIVALSARLAKDSLLFSYYFLKKAVTHK